jgi:uncharacterized protein
MDINYYLDLDRRARADLKKYPKKRILYTTLVSEKKGTHYCGIVGPRGVGKTILLKQLALTYPDSLYLSLDACRDDLFDIIRCAHDDLGIRAFLLDEIHYVKDFERCLKNCYDFFAIDIIFTSSVSLALYESRYDLSRRVSLHSLYPFSFREYVLIKHGITVPPLTLVDIIKNNITREHREVATYFQYYLTAGILPFALDEPQPLPFLKNIVDTVIHKDIPSIMSVKVDDLQNMHDLLAFIGNSAVDSMNYSTIANNLKITKYKVKQYIDLLEKAFILNPVFPRGAHVLQEPKILMAVPYRLLFRSFDEAKGALREDFFVEALRGLECALAYLKTTRGKKTPDFFVHTSAGDVVVEVGGKGKGHSQFKGVRVDQKIIFTHEPGKRANQYPLFLVGLLDSIG